jgi:methyl-accepting chemotaxis protein
MDFFKKNNIIFKIILNTFIVTFIGTTIVSVLDFISKILVLQNIMISRLYSELISDYIGYFLSLMLNYIPFLLMSSVIIFFIVRPIQSVHNKLINNEKLSDLELKKSKDRIFQLHMLVLIVNFLGFALGGIVFIIKEGAFSSTQIFFMVLFNLASPGLYAFIQISLNNQILQKTRSLLNIYYIDKNQKMDLNFQFKNIILFVIIISYGLSFVIFNQIKIYDTQTFYASSLESIVSKNISTDDAKKEYIGNIKITDKQNAVYPLNNGNIKDINTVNSFYMLLSFIFIMVISFVGILIYTNEVTKQIKFQEMSLEEILKGKKNITDRINIIQNDELGKLSDTINRFMDKIREILFQISNSSSRISEKSGFLNNNVESTSIAIGEMADSNKQADKFTGEQMKAVEITKNKLGTIVSNIEKISTNVFNLTNFVEETASAMQEMASSIESVNQIAAKTKGLSNNLVDITKEGQGSIENSVDAIKKIEDASNKVMDIIMIMTDISTQTNLLALNAAIEAAHAGEAGKGFAVVADEIRKLAENSSVQEKEIENHIKTMLTRIKNGVMMSEGAGQAFKKIDVEINNMTNMITEVSSAMSEHRDGTNQILSSVGSVVKATEEIKELTENLRTQSDEIKHQINELENRSIEINKDTKKQTVRIEEILKIVENVNVISGENLEDVSKLQQTIGIFKI